VACNSGGRWPHAGVIKILPRVSWGATVLSRPHAPLSSTWMTACSAPSSLSVEGPFPSGTKGQCSSVTEPPSSTAQTLMLEVKTKEPPDAGPDHRLSADWTFKGYWEGEAHACMGHARPAIISCVGLASPGANLPLPCSLSCPRGVRWRRQSRTCGRWAVLPW